MFLPFVALSLIQLFYYSHAIPVAPPGQNADGTIILPNAPDTSLSTTFAALMLPNTTADDESDLTFGSRPRRAKIYPELSSGKYHIRFHDYGKDIDSTEGASVLAKAAHEVDDWIAAARKHSYTPVEHEHSWKSGRVELSAKPHGDGYLLGDLQIYLALMTAFHAKYGVFWEWDAQLIGGGGFGVGLKGTAKFKIA